ncbi:hypothetical protein Acf1_00018 [Acidovorax phage ACF1]|nr:hypothetical protein Acf1_00018 [Acidovorax phage ACF1]
MDIAEIRRQNLRALIEKHGGSKLAKMLGYASPSFLSQQAGPNPTREVTERSARAFEKKLGLPPGHLDRLPEAEDAPPAAQAMSPDVIANVIRLVGSLMQAEAIDVPAPQRFSDVIALAVTDTLEHGGVPREQHIRRVVRLLKG